MDTKSETKDNFRQSISAADDEVVQCPNCNADLKRYEVAEHCQLEMEQLQSLHSKITKTEIDTTSENATTTQNGDERRKPWSVFQRVQRNRQIRLKQRTRKRPTPPPPPSDYPCPMCNGNFSQSEIQRHARQCLRRNNSSNDNGRDDNSSDDDDEAEEYEEYEWAGQKRIRVSSLLQGGYASLGIGQSTSQSNDNQQANEDDEDEDLNVDEDDTQIYGPAQYGECDVLPITSSDNGNSVDLCDVTNYMRRLISTSGNNVNHNNEIDSRPVPPVEGVNQTTNLPTPDLQASENHTATIATSSSILTPQHYHHIIDSLKGKLRQYESQVQNKFKCLICLDDYKNPAISVSCWHVHCEQCWLRSLGARKLCPQCNLITTPKDLRRIYM